MFKLFLIIMTSLICVHSTRMRVRCGNFAQIYDRKPCDDINNCDIPYGTSIVFENIEETASLCGSDRNCILNNGTMFKNCTETYQPQIWFNCTTNGTQGVTCVMYCEWYYTRHFVPPPVYYTTEYHPIPLTEGEYTHIPFNNWKYSNIVCVQGVGAILEKLNATEIEPTPILPSSSSTTTHSIIFLFFLIILNLI